MPTESELFHRLAARGYFEIVPSGYAAKVDHDETCDPDCRWEHSESRPGVGITWAPTGQGGPNGGRARFNFLVTRTVVKPTLREALETMVEATTPPWRSLDDLVAHRLYEKAREV